MSDYHFPFIVAILRWW